MIHWESQLERDAVYLFEFSPGVAAYREQPFKVHYGMDGVMRRYTPDFELTLITGEIILVEVKPEQKLQEPENVRRFNHIKGHFKRHEQLFCILTEHDIRQPNLLENLRMLMRYRGKRPSRFQLIAFSQKLNGRNSISFADAVTLFGDVGTVWILIDESLLICDLKQLVNSQTIFSTVFKESSDEKLYF